MQAGAGWTDCVRACQSWGLTRVSVLTQPQMSPCPACPSQQHWLTIVCVPRLLLALSHSCPLGKGTSGEDAQLCLLEKKLFQHCLETSLLFTDLSWSFQLCGRKQQSIQGIHG